LVSRRETAVTAKEAQQLMRAVCADLGIALPTTGGWRFLLEHCTESDFWLSGSA
jgi:hypothetical protein